MSRSKGAEALDLNNTGSAYYAPASTSLLRAAGQSTSGFVPADYESQIHLALLNLRRILLAAGARVDDITKLTTLHRQLRPGTAQAYQARHRPAITLVPVSQLAVPSWLFEIDAVCLARCLAARLKWVDVVVIGAGIAGLTAATDVRKAGLSCVVLEARDRGGGKTWSQNVVHGEGVVDLGAAWINDVSQSKVYALAKRYGTKMLEQNTTGKCVLEDKNGVISTFEHGQLPNHLARLHDIRGLYPISRGSIAFQPALPLAKQAWIESTTYGYYTKAMMVFRTPFWVDKGYCGLIQSFTGPASVIRDTSSEPDGKYILTCFMAADTGRAWASLSTPEREQALVAQIGKLYDSELEAARDVVEMLTYEWAKDEYYGWGCPCTALTPGVLDLLGGEALRTPSGNLHWAGTETAAEWKGYMEGALRSGERAAAEVVTGLTHVNARL
ncbi:hypothetical protein NLU13_1740 [Sarocladium strictum]|uniref:monoamine oxidase n=1 Tax=Sarocladium strictum TaxID=5046 RepID=A0AA39GRI4_SARSR|nr:hypothetical protein NLU13_1740 [Sarocladium strictum]